MKEALLRRSGLVIGFIILGFALATIPTWTINVESYLLGGLTAFGSELIYKLLMK